MEKRISNRYNLAKKLIKQIVLKIGREEKLNDENREKIRILAKAQISDLSSKNSEISEKMHEEVENLLEDFDLVYEQVYSECSNNQNKEEKLETKEQYDGYDKITIEEKADAFNMFIRMQMQKIREENEKIKAREIEKAKIKAEKLEYMPIENGKIYPSRKVSEDREIGE